MNSHPGAAGRPAGRYEIVRQIGQGAMATVYLARQLDLDRDVALKELDRVGIGRPAVLAQRFLREARLAGSLSHPNIVTVYEYFEDAGRPFIAMEHAQRGSLREHITNLSLSQTIGVLDSLLAALTHAETRGIVHRDIKPENILVTADGRIKIADFGIARAYSVIGGTLLTATGTTVGTPMYMAPEQATGKQISIATDLYAVGTVAFEMLLGRVPFGTGESPLAILWQHINEAHPDPRALRPDLDPGLSRWVEQLLAKDAADRPPSAAAASDALEEIALELLGSRWRRDAPLLAPAPANPPAAEPDQLAPRAPVATGPRHAVAPARDPADPGATRAAEIAVVAPQALDDHEDGEAHPAARREPAAGTARSAGADARWSITASVFVVAATLAATAGGYLAFHRDGATPGPAIKTQPVAADAAAAAARFANGVDAAFEPLNETRVRARKRLAAARTARAQAVQARAVASAYRKAARAVDGLEAAADQLPAAARLTDELARTARSYDALAAAAVASRPKTYEARRRAVRVRESTVRRTAREIYVVGADIRAG